MKKSSKTSPAPAPAKKSAPAAQKAPATAKSAIRKAPVTAVPAGLKSPATTAPTGLKPPAPTAVKKTAAKAFVTTISARIDVGFGNMLYVRGEGSGLSWDKGMVMACTGDDRWTLALGESIRPLVFKFLLNDQVWSSGEDYTAKPGAAATFTPAF